MKDNYANKSEELLRYGFTVFQNAISQETCDIFKSLIDTWFDDPNIKSDVIDDKRFANFVVPDAISNEHFKDMELVFNAQHLLPFLKYHCDANVMYLDHFDAHRNLSSGWHEDSNQKHFKEGNNHANASIFHPDYKVYRVCFYLQDHDIDGCGLSVKPGTHLYPKSSHSSFDNGIALGTKKGDMIVFDCRLSHRGIVYNNSKMKDENTNRHSIFLCLGAEGNIFSETHRMGAFQRQNKQLKRQSYKIKDSLRSHLKSLGYSVYDENSVFYK